MEGQSQDSIPKLLKRCKGCARGNGSRPLKPEEEGIAGGFEAWTLWGVVSATMVSDSGRA
jgi:hypothetical protein